MHLLLILYLNFAHFTNINIWQGGHLETVLNCLSSWELDVKTDTTLRWMTLQKMNMLENGGNIYKTYQDLQGSLFHVVSWLFNLYKNPTVSMKIKQRYESGTCSSFDFIYQQMCVYFPKCSNHCFNSRISLFLPLLCQTFHPALPGPEDQPMEGECIV